jgi:Viral proteins of unknown function
MNPSALINYSLKLTEEMKENILPRIDKLLVLRMLINNKIRHDDVYRFGFADREELIGAVMKINVDTYLPDADLIHTKNPTYVYFRICQKCHNAADVPLSNDHSVRRYICDFCGMCLVIDDPVQTLGHEEGIEELLNIQIINSGDQV